MEHVLSQSHGLDVFKPPRVLDALFAGILCFEARACYDFSHGAIY